MGAKNQLPEKYKVFCIEYMKDLNGTRAAQVAGYAKASAHVASSRMLKNDKVQAYLTKLRKKLMDKNMLSVDRIIAEYARIAFLNITDIANWDKEGEVFFEPSIFLTEDQQRAVCEVKKIKRVDKKGGATHTTKLKVHDKMKALDALGKHLGMFPTKVELTGNEGGPVQFLDKSKKCEMLDWMKNPELRKAMLILAEAAAEEGPDDSGEN